MAEQRDTWPKRSSVSTRTIPRPNSLTQRQTFAWVRPITAKEERNHLVCVCFLLGETMAQKHRATSLEVALVLLLMVSVNLASGLMTHTVLHLDGSYMRLFEDLMSDCCGTIVKGFPAPTWTAVTIVAVYSAFELVQYNTHAQHIMRTARRLRHRTHTHSHAILLLLGCGGGGNAQCVVCLRHS